MTLLPASRQLDCPLPQHELLSLRLSDLRVLRVEPAQTPAPEALPPQPLGPLVWELALRGARSELLPEIAGVAAYRVNPGVSLQMLDLSGTLAHAVMRLRRQPTVPSAVHRPRADHQKRTSRPALTGPALSPRSGARASPSRSVDAAAARAKLARVGEGRPLPSDSVVPRQRHPSAGATWVRTASIRWAL